MTAAGHTYWTERRVLVTGATGFIGQHLVRRLIEGGAAVFAATSPAREHPAPRRNDGKERLHELSFDVRDAAAVRSAVKHAKPSIVFHLAAVGVTDPDVDAMEALTVNAGGAINLLEALRDSNVEQVVLSSTSYVYGSRGDPHTLDPFNAYSASKVAAWAFARMYWRTYNIPIVTVRPFQVYGPGQPPKTLIPSAIRAALSGDDFPMTPGEQLRDFVFVRDVTEGMMRVAETQGIGGASLDLGTGIGTPVRDVVEQIWELTGAAGNVRTGALPYRAGTAMDLVANADQTARLTAWRATTDREDGLRVTIDHLRTQRQQTQ